MTVRQRFGDPDLLRRIAPRRPPAPSRYGVRVPSGSPVG